MPKIAQQLGVAHVLEGSVQKAGPQVRVTVQLIRAATDSHLWAETYDRNLTDIFAVESEVAEKIAQSLSAELTGAEQQAVSAKPTDNPEAYEAYLHGLALWNRIQVSPADIENTILYFARATQLDPHFASAWARLSVANMFSYASFDRTPQRLTQAKQALDQATSLAPESGETQFALGLYRYRALADYEGALAAFEKVSRTASGRVEALEFSAYVKRRQGKWDEALAFHHRSLELDPQNLILLSEAASTHLALRQFDEARQLLHRGLAIDPKNAPLLVQQAGIAQARGDLETASLLLEKVPVRADDPLLFDAHIRQWVYLRRYDEATRVLRHTLAAPGAISPVLRQNYRASLGMIETLNGPTAEAKRDLTTARDELATLRAGGDKGQGIAIDLLLTAGLLGDHATVERVAAELQDEIAHDAMTGPNIEANIAVARAWLGEKEAAITTVGRLLATNGENPLTPALLRIDPFWSPLRSDPRFKELANP